MSLASNIAITIVALIHVYILVLEMFLWDKPIGLRAFGQTKEAATASKVLAANQGLYNGFLAAGLFLSLTQGHDGFHLAIFFLTCVATAGIFGAVTLKPTTLLLQTVPGLAALAAVWLARST